MADPPPEITVRHAEPPDAEALHRLFQDRSVIAGTLQLPFPRLALWQERLQNPPEGLYQLVACMEDEVVGEPTLSTNPTRPRMRHIDHIGMAVRKDRQGQGVGTQLVRSALELADNWLSLTRLELHVYVDNAAGIALYKSSASRSREPTAASPSATVGTSTPIRWPGSGILGLRAADRDPPASSSRMEVDKI